MILGVDEAGRGPWAGPLAVGAVVLADAVTIDGLNDSKVLTAKRRQSLEPIIKQQAVDWALGWASAQEIDDLGLGVALNLATKRAVEQITKQFDEIIIDGKVNLLAGTSLESMATCLVKADSLIPSVSAASILAKVARDRYMTKLSEQYPGYGFEQNAGYGVAWHISAIEQLGVTPEHRLSFKPLHKYSDNQPVADSPLPPKLSTRQIGDASESVAANELTRLGHKIVERNWKTKYCEIDIISRLDDTYYFTEVKHRRNFRSGSGLDAITRKKLHQMEFAARLYTKLNSLFDFNLRLVVIETTEGDYQITNNILIG